MNTNKKINVLLWLIVIWKRFSKSPLHIWPHNMTSMKLKMCNISHYVCKVIEKREIFLSTENIFIIFYDSEVIKIIYFI